MFGLLNDIQASAIKLVELVDERKELEATDKILFPECSDETCLDLEASGEGE